MNALKFGIDAESTIIEGEDPDAYQALLAEYHDQFQPATPAERALVDTLVHTDWLRRRITRIEAQVWNHLYAAGEDNGTLNPSTALGAIFCENAPVFSRIQRRIDSAERNYLRTLKELQRLQAAAPKPIPAPAPSLQPVAIPATYHSIGFVPQPVLRPALVPTRSPATSPLNSPNSSKQPAHNATRI